MSYTIEDMKADELPFVLNAYKMNLRHSERFHKLGNAAAFAVLNPLVNATVNDSGVLCATQGRRVLGFLVFEVVGDDLLVHFAYVKHAFRRNGIARELLSAALEACPGVVGVYYTTPTTRFEAVATRYGLELRSPA